MNRFLLLSALLATMPAQANDACQETPSSPITFPPDSLISPADWLSPGKHQIGLTHALRFVPATQVSPPLGEPRPFPLGPPGMDVDQLEATDPADGRQRSLRFLLETRINAEGVVVLRQGKQVLDYRRTGFDPTQARLLLDASRPILATMLARAAGDGRISREKALNRVISEFSPVRELSKVSVQRVFSGRSGLQWSRDDLERWEKEARGQSTGRSGIRAWLNKRGNWPRAQTRPAPDLQNPSAELLLWLNEKAWQRRPPQLLCELQQSIKARHPAYWTQDAKGNYVADGLGLSLEDFARFGQSLIDTRQRRAARPLAPAWFMESISTPSDSLDIQPPELAGLKGKSTWQYYFTQPGDRGRQAAIIGSYGTSLYLDFDKNIVVAVFASNAAKHSALLSAALDSLWQTSRKISVENERR